MNLSLNCNKNGWAGGGGGGGVGGHTNQISRVASGGAAATLIVLHAPCAAPLKSPPTIDSASGQLLWQLMNRLSFAFLATWRQPMLQQRSQIGKTTAGGRGQARGRARGQTNTERAGERQLKCSQSGPGSLLPRPTITQRPCLTEWAGGGGGAGGREQEEESTLERWAQLKAHQVSVEHT